MNIVCTKVDLGNINVSFGTDSDKAFVYTADLALWRQDIPSLWECLSVAEKTTAKKYYSDYLIERYIVSHGILRHILSYHTMRSPSQITFTHNKYGKPFLQDDMYDIQFNISYSRDRFYCAVTTKQQVGIDIEFDDNSLHVEELSDLVFTPKEMQHAANIEASDRHKFFYNVWTKKEALAKAIGNGLSYPINTIETIKTEADKNVILIDKNDQCQREWYCTTLNVIPSYSLAIATERKVSQVIYLELNHPTSNLEIML